MKPKNAIKQEEDALQNAFWDTEKAELVIDEAKAKLARVRGDMQDIKKRLKAFRESGKE